MGRITQIITQPCRSLQLYMLCWHLSANTFVFYVKAVCWQWCQMAYGWLVHMKMSHVSTIEWVTIIFWTDIHGPLKMMVIP